VTVAIQGTGEETPLGYLDPLRVEALDTNTWTLLDRFRWQGSEGDLFVVEAGEETDFATVPWWTQSLIPRTGTWTKAAVLHDKMCRELIRIHRERLVLQGERTDLDWAEVCEEIKPVFTSIDTDLIFRKNARAEGTGPIRAELLWLGVRYGAAVNPARREGYLKTLPRVTLDTLLVLLTVVVIIAGLSWAWPW
jgi:hypothetical protein